MKIVKYKVLLNEDNKNVLVKENAQLYYCAGGVLNSPEKIVQMCNEVLQANRLAEEYIWLQPTTTLLSDGPFITLYPIPAKAVSGCIPFTTQGVRPDFTYSAKERAHIIWQCRSLSIVFSRTNCVATCFCAA